MKLRFLGLVTCLVASAAGPLHADVVYDFNGFTHNYSDNTTNPNLKQADGVTDFVNNAQRSFSLNPMQPGSNYSGPPFYGGYTVKTPAGNGYGYVRIESDQLVNSATGDLIRFTQNFTTGAISNNAIFMGNTINSTFDGTSSVTVRIVRDTGTMRLVLRSGGSYYVSNQALNIVNGSGFPAQTFSLSTLTYSAYSPATDMAYASSPSSYNPFTTGFDAAGLLFSRTGSATVNTYLGQFTVNARPVPVGTTYTVTPGVAPYPTVQSALNVALSPGDRVYVPAGTYRERVQFKASGSALSALSSIVLEGAPGAVIDGSQNVTLTWQQAPAPFQAGVYRAQVTSFTPRTVMANGKWVLQLDKTKADSSPATEPFWKDIFNTAAPGGSGWDGIRALAMYDNATGEKWLYLRFQGNLNPTSQAITVAPVSTCVDINGFNYCAVRGLAVKNGTTGVNIASSVGSIVEHCNIGPVEYGVYLTTGADRCAVRYNDIHLDPYWGADPWREAAYDAWEVNKREGWSNRYAVYLGNTKGGNEVNDNYIHDHWDGVNSNGNSTKLLGDKVHHNYFFTLFDNTVKASYNQANNEFHDNIMDIGRVAFRISNPDAPGPLFVYRNIFIENKNDIRVNSGSTYLPISEIWVYHNTFMADTSVGVEFDVPDSHTPDYHFYNNLFWCITSAREPDNGPTYEPGELADVDWDGDYNVFVKAAPGDRPFPAEWDALSASTRLSKWNLGIAQANEAGIEQHSLWQATGLPGFVDSDNLDLALASTSIARDRGANLVPLALPGAPTDATPDAGALQFGEVMPVLPRP